MGETTKRSGYDVLIDRLLDMKEEELAKAEKAKQQEKYDDFRKCLHNTHEIDRCMELLDKIEKSRRV